MLAGAEMQIACLVGIAPWKRQRIRQLLDAPDVPLARTATQAVEIAQKSGGAIAGWATRLPDGLPEKAAAAGVPLWRIEDGFIRSAGLGAALHLPASIVLDKSGIYYDPTNPSDLEHILSHRDFANQELARAHALIDSLRRLRVTKYNLGGAQIDLPVDRRVSLVIGQVADDASMALGAAGKDTDALIKAARAADPEALLVYKPHPDVVAGLRAGVLECEADVIAQHADVISLIDRADAVHVLSSLTGFEALLRGKSVHVHGQPFYAGWGLTNDIAPPPRRGRILTLAQLVAGALIAYPRYCHPETGDRIAVEELVALLATMQASRSRVSLGRRLAGQAALAIRRLKDKA
jgi:capsule polysaccharide export protein KpsC/LpsZ